MFFNLGCKKPITNSFVIENGVLDLTQLQGEDFDEIKLDGNWDFKWGEFVSPDQKQYESQIPVPGAWSDFEKERKSERSGYATYHLKILFPYEKQIRAIYIPSINTATRIFLNGIKVHEVGKIGMTKESETPKQIPVIKYLEFPRESHLTIYISNFHHRTGGIRKSFSIGNPDFIQNKHFLSSVVDFFFIGSLTIIGLYHLILFWIRKKEISPLVFGLLSLILAVRSTVAGEVYISHFFPDLSWDLIRRIEYFTFYGGAPLVSGFIMLIFPVEFNRKMHYLTLGLSLVFSSFVFVTSPKFFSGLLPYFQVYIGILILYAIFVLGKSIQRKREGAKQVSVGMLLFLLGVANDILNARGIIHTMELAHFGLFAYIFSQSYVLAVRFSNAFFRSESLSLDLKATNRAYSRFVPSEFLNFLNKESITDIHLGDQVQREMSVLFCDIRSFTSLSEKMSPEENFNFLNSYLQRVGPVIRNHKGFIDKYIGDGIMALFPVTAEDAVRCAIDIQKEILIYNQHRQSQGYDPIKVGIGVHTGNLILGTVGENERMEGTVISDAVNLASRVEGLTKVYNASILVTMDTFLKIPDTSEYNFRILDKVQVKGKQEFVTVVEILDGRKTEDIEKIIVYKNEFDLALNLYLVEKYGEAILLLRKILEQNPWDTPAKIYLQRCLEKEPANEK